MASRQKDVKKILKKLKKRYPDDPIVLSRDRKILEHLVFAIFLENVSFERAREAFTAMENYFIDWNEIRVSKANEIADVVPVIPNAPTVGERLRRLLQWIFDETYKFDLEDMRAKGRDEFYAFLRTVPFSTAFMNDYVSLFCFGNGNFPLDEGELRALRLLNLVETSEENREIVPALEGAFNETERLEFFFALHELGSELNDDSRRGEAIKFLCSIDAKAAERSWTPLVEASEPTDPREIARLVAKQERHQKHSAPSLLDAMLLDDSDDVEGCDDLSDESEEPQEYTAGFEEESGVELNDSCDLSREKNMKKRRVRKETKETIEKGANEETELTKNGATYSHFSVNDEPLFEALGQDALEGEFKEKKSSAKPRKKNRYAESSAAFLFEESDEQIVRKDEPNIANELENSLCDSLKSKSDLQEPAKPRKKARVKTEPPADAEKEEKKNASIDAGFVAEHFENAEKEGDKKSLSARKTASKKGKEKAIEADSVDEKATKEPKMKTKPKNAKSEDFGVSDAAEKSASKKNSKTKELQQKKPR